MNSAPLPPTLRATAPDLARRLAPILVALAALIARAFLRNPARVALIVPLWRTITHTALRFTKLATRLAAGRLPRPSRPGKPSTSPRIARYPARHGWLVADLGYEAVGYASQLAHLLAQPDAVELLATIPAAGRLLHPVCRMLGLPQGAPRPRPRPRPAIEPAEPSTPKPRPARPRAPSRKQFLDPNWPWLPRLAENPA